MRIISGTSKGVKLETIDGLETRPTLDRIKESLFNIIQSKITDAKVLDLFSGSGSLGIEALSRGAELSVLSDNSKKSIEVIKKNLEKTKLKEKAVVINKDYKNCLKELSGKYEFDIIFIDPPYDSDYYKDSLMKIKEFNLLSKNGIIILETNNIEKETYEISKLEYDMYDERKYGKTSLIFLSRKG